MDCRRIGVVARRNMQYFGGKSRLVKHLKPIIEAELGRPEVTHYWEPFVGGGSVFCNIVTDKIKVASDACAPLIALWEHGQAGGSVPTEVSESEYAAAKRGECEPWRQAFIGFACSFGGKWFGGYARDTRGGNYALQGHNSLLNKARPLKTNDVFVSLDYRACVSLLCDQEGDGMAVVYCDPPYAGTTGYSAVAPWDVGDFWEQCRYMAQQHIVLVSEYQAPADVPCVFERAVKTEIRSRTTRLDRVERLFRLAPPAFPPLVPTWRLT